MSVGLANTAHLGRGNKGYLKPALVLALLTHAIVILGIQVNAPTPVSAVKDPVWSFDVSLLQPPGGAPDTAPAAAALQPPQPAPAPPPPFQAPEVKAPESKNASALVATLTDATTTPPQPEHEPEPQAQSSAALPPPASEPADPLKLNVADLMQQGLQQARLAADQAQTGNTRKKYADLYRTTTPDGAYAAYWVRKVEGVGELNLSQALRQARTSGPVLDVAIRADGSLQHVHIVQPSGNEQLDATIRRIVTEAAPYAPFPAALQRECDVLHIKHKWIFR